MSTHPYWAYQAVPGSIEEAREKEAVDEGRRGFALELAVQLFRADPTCWTADEFVRRAETFEAYLKGGVSDGAEVRLLGVQEAGHGDEEQPVQESLERRW